MAKRRGWEERESGEADTCFSSLTPDPLGEVECWAASAEPFLGWGLGLENICNICTSS